jgi:nucleoside-diphosphate-sugar epimerase
MTLKVLITGASGFIGTHLINKMMNLDYGIWCLQNSKTIHNSRLNLIPFNLKAFKDSDLPDSIDVIIHLAQSYQYRSFPTGAKDMFAINVESTAKLLTYAVKAGAKKFIFASTGNVYEPYESSSFLENGTLSPTSYYGASKLAAETLCNAYSNIMDIVNLRLFFPYGPLQTDKLIPSLIEKIHSGSSITIEGEEGLTLCPTYVEDVIDIIELCITENWSGTFNVASPEIVSLKQISLEIAQAIGKEPNFNYFPENRSLKIIPNLNKLKNLYDLSKFHSFSNGLRKMRLLNDVYK